MSTGSSFRVVEPGLFRFRPADWGDAYQIEAAAAGFPFSGEAHLAYFQPRNPAMKNLGHILIGDNENVTPKK